MFVSSARSAAGPPVQAPCVSVMLSGTARPSARWAGAGSVALASEARTWIELVTVATVVQVLSHARTVIVNGTPTVCARAVPVLPEGVPGAADSPGMRI